MLPHKVRMWRIVNRFSAEVKVTHNPLKLKMDRQPFLFHSRAILVDTFNFTIHRCCCGNAQRAGSVFFLRSRWTPGTIDACAQPLATLWLLLFILQTSNGFVCWEPNSIQFGSPHFHLVKFGRKSPFFSQEIPDVVFVFVYTRIALSQRTFWWMR